MGRRHNKNRGLLIFTAFFLTLSALTAGAGILAYTISESPLMEKNSSSEEAPPPASSLLEEPKVLLPYSLPAQEAALSQPGVAISTPDPSPGHQTIRVLSSRMHEGPLILVGRDHPYHFPDEEKAVSVYSKKNSSYEVKDREVSLSPDVISPLNRMFSSFEQATGLRDVCVLSGYRDFNLQRRLYDDRAAEQGRAAAAEYVASPGYSEHHTGYAFDLSIYTEEGDTVDFNGQGAYAWIGQNAHRFGFILRFPDKKQAFTKIAYEPWHYRYIGEPHATYLKEQGLCLEEYVALLHGYEFGSDPLLLKDADGGRYQVYHVMASGEEETKIPVPIDRAYTISGDNLDGFIVTVKE